MLLDEVVLAFAIAYDIPVDVLCCLFLQLRVLLADFGMGFQVVAEGKMAMDIWIACYESMEVMRAVIAAFFEVAPPCNAVLAFSDVTGIDEFLGLVVKC